MPTIPLLLSILVATQPTPEVRLLRAPDRAIQPQAAFAQDGTLHLLYFTGEPAAGDLRYTHRAPDDDHWADPITVNSAPNAAVALGNIRGGKLALAPDGTVHILWNGSRQTAEAGRGSPLLYARLDPGVDTFTNQRNLLTRSGVLDGGADIAAGPAGAVYAAWHGVPDGTTEHTEAARRVFVAISSDAGRTFAPEQQWSDPINAACACCALAIDTDADAQPLVLYRAARDGSRRGMHLLGPPREGAPADRALDEWHLNACPMSLPSISPAPGTTALAWEFEHGIHWTITSADANEPTIHTAGAKGSKHPSIATDADGNTLLAWTDGISWGSTGQLRWTLFAPDATALETPTTDAATVPAWSIVTTTANPAGGFVIIY